MEREVDTLNKLEKQKQGKKQMLYESLPKKLNFLNTLNNINQIRPIIKVIITPPNTLDISFDFLI